MGNGYRRYGAKTVSLISLSVLHLQSQLSSKSLVSSFSANVSTSVPLLVYCFVVMFGFLNRARVQSLCGSKYVGDYNTRFVYFLENASLTVDRPFSSTESVVSGNKNDLEEKIRSFTVSYLINSCGLYPAAASSLSSQVKFKSSIQRDSVLRVLRDQGFTDADISVLVRKQPKLLLAKLGTTLSPKLEFFNSISDLVKVLCWNPTLLTRSLKNHLIPCYDFLKTLFLEDSCEEKVANVLKRASCAKKPCCQYIHYESSRDSSINHF